MLDKFILFVINNLCMKLDLLLNLLNEQTNLFNASSFLGKIKEEMLECSQNEYSEVKFAVAYITKSGINELIPSIIDILENKGTIKILTCLDFGTTEIEAINRILELKKYGEIQIKVYDNPNGNFHPKFFLFSHSKFKKFIIGSNNLTYKALTKNIECALLSDTKNVYNNLESYFIFLWRESKNITKQLLNDYTNIKSLIEKHNSIITENIDAVNTKQKIETISPEKIIEIEKYIEVFRNYYGTPTSIVFWRDVTLDEVLILLKESNRLKEIKQRELILDLIREDQLHYKSDKSIGSYLNYSKFMRGLGFWDESGLTSIGTLALKKYEKSKLEFLLFVQFSLLVFGNLFSFCYAINQANSSSFHEDLKTKVLKNKWIESIYDEVNQILTQKNLCEIGFESIKRYFPTLFNKYGFENSLEKKINTIYYIKLAGIIDFIFDYGKSLELDIRKFQNNFVGNI